MNFAVIVPFVRRFTVLNGAVRELWLVFLAKLLGVVAYSVMNTTFVLWLSYDLGYSDARAGFVVAAWSIVMTLLTVVVGSLTDAIGLRKALLLGLVVCVASRAVLTFTTVSWLALVGGMLPLALGEALGVPVLVAGIRRYSTTAQRSISFAIFYAMMNVGFLIASLLFDYVRTRLGEPHGSLVLPVLGQRLTTYRVLFLLSFLFELILLILVFFSLRDGVEATDEGVVITPESNPFAGTRFGLALGRMMREATRDTCRIFAGLWRQSGFYKFLAFLGFAAFVRLIFIHMYYTYPKFGIRELGEGAPVGRLFAINSILIIFLVPIVGALSQNVSAFKMVKVGSLIAALSVFTMAAPPRWFQPLADGWFGHQLANRALGGYSRFSPDDFRDVAGLAARLETPTNAFAAFLQPLLSAATRALLRRELAPGGRGPAWPSHPSTALFAPADLSDGVRLVARLAVDSDPSTRPVSAFLFSRFSPKGQAAVQDKASARYWGRGEALASELNHLLHGKSIYREDRFAGVILSEAARSLVVESTPGPGPGLPNQALLLNRLLLEDLYPAEIPRSHHPARVALAEDFSRIIGGLSLCDRLGADVPPLSDATRALRGRPAVGRELVRLNRMVIEDAFAQEIAPNRVGVPGSVSPYYVMIFLFIVALSVGESIYSPRLYEYAAAIAPKGQEGSYMSLSYLPFFLAKLLVASFSGVLLAGFCPESGPRHSEVLWLIIALTTLIAPAGLFLFGRFIRVPEAGRES